MKHNCTCGGRLAPCANLSTSAIAVFKCDRCGYKLTQRKRQPAKTDATIVREALRKIADESSYTGWWSALAENASDADLCKLRRLLK